VNCVRFSLDGKMLVTTSKDGTARVWTTNNWTTVTVFSEHTGSVNDAAFSPDGKLVVSASADNTAMVWEPVTGRRIATLSDSSGAVNDASFSPDGKLILTASAHGTAPLWGLNTEVSANTSTDELSALACRKATRNMTADEWRQYMGAEPYRATCQNLPQPQATPAAQVSPPDSRLTNVNAGTTSPQNMNMKYRP
jgi:WD40 repeat protein